MYNYNQIPTNFNKQINTPYNLNNQNSYDNRLVGGGFLGPFVLGGLTGGLVAPFFYGNNRPNYNYYYPYPPYPPYRPYGPYYR